jgi:hypothetical protein
MNCFQCSKWFNSFPELFSHFRHLHGLPSTGCEVRCTYDDCPRVFQTFQRLKDHALLQHKVCISSEFAAVSAAELHSDCENPDIGASSTTQNLTRNDHREVNVQHSFMRFITTIGSKPGVSQSAVQDITEELSSLVNDLNEYAVHIVNDLIDQLSVAFDDPRVSAAISTLNDMPKFISGVDKQHKRNKWLLDNKYLIPPVEIVLGI